MKNKLMSIIVCLITVISCFSLNGCLENGKYEDEFFICKKINNNVSIIGLTDLGKEQSVLVVPKQIEGLTITRIGKIGMIGFGNPPVAGKNLKKIFVKYPVTFIRGSFFASPNLENIIWLNFDASYLTNYSDQGDYAIPYCVINKETYDEIKLTEKEWLFRRFKIANIEFRLNYKEGKEDIFWLDNEPAESLITKWYEGYYSPEREGYNFAGWYKEPECVNEWDFENDKTPTEILDEETNEPILQITKLYAKWEKK